MKKLGIVLICIVFIFGCEKKEESKLNNITSEEAYKIMEDESDIFILDVRTASEYESGHIKNAVNIPLDSLEETVSSVVSDKGAKLLVYCQSGRRSEEASKKLLDLGYTDINNFGGLNNWTYGVVTE